MASRRSERSRPSQHAPTAPAHSASSSSVSSNRADRVTRSNHKQNSSNKSSTPHSLSSEDVDDARAHQGEPPQMRLRSREQENDDVDGTRLDDDLDDAGSEEPEEEVTRCICGHQEWPGPAVVTGDPENDEGGGFFIQCDICKVWQHGGCIGLPEDLVPDSYYCEECKPQLHRLFVNPQGQKYSWYLDVPTEVKQYRDKLEKERDKHKIPRKPSLPKEAEVKTVRDREKAAKSSVEAFKKRRSTMNSRAAVDDDEVLRKVLEESKTDTYVAVSESSTRKGKRSRDESEEVSQETKRPRTGSRSLSSSPTVQDEKEAATRSNGISKGKPRGAAARSQRDKELREEKERERAEAAGRRKGRAERRRGEEEPAPVEVEVPPVDDAVQQTEVVEAETPDTPSASANSAPVVKKSGRPPNKRGNRAGRNQHTRDNATPNNGGSPGRNNSENSPLSPSGRANGESGGNGSDGASGKPNKARNWRLEKMTWNDIRKPASMMLNYIQQRQVEMAEKTGIGAMVMTPPSAAANAIKDTPKKTEEVTLNADGDDDIEKFKNLSSVEMMDYLSRDIELWNQTVKDY